MRILSKMRKQSACHWVRNGTDEWGQPSYATAVQRRVRWDEVVELFTDKSGSSFASKAKVYTDYTEAYKPDDAMWLGALVDLPVACATNPFAQQIGAYNVRRVDRIWTLKADQAAQLVWL